MGISSGRNPLIVDLGKSSKKPKTGRLPLKLTAPEIGTEASETTRTYPVTLLMDQPEGFKILPGMAGKVTAAAPSGSHGGDSVVVPASAIFSPHEDKTSYIWIIDEQTKTVSRRAVTATQLTDRGIQVTSGLKAGEWIATAEEVELEVTDRIELAIQELKELDYVESLAGQHVGHLGQHQTRILVRPTASGVGRAAPQDSRRGDPVAARCRPTGYLR